MIRRIVCWWLALAAILVVALVVGAMRNVQRDTARRTAVGEMCRCLACHPVTSNSAWWGE